MIGKNYKYNNTNISRKTADFQVGLTTVNWTGLDVSDEESNVQGYHGIKLSPTYVRGRRIIIEGLIIADSKFGSSKGISYLQDLFSLQGITDETEFKSFSLTDEQDRNWEIQAKIKEPLELELEDDDYYEGANRRFRVVLQSADPVFYSPTTQEVIGLEGYYGGVKLGTKLGTKMDEYFNEIEVIGEGNIETPLKFIITAGRNVNGPLMIKNRTTGSFFGLDINGIAGDVFIIDSKNQTATKNGENILATRIEGSLWHKVKGENYFGITDFDGGLYESDFDIKIQYKNALL